MHRRRHYQLGRLLRLWFNLPLGCKHRQPVPLGLARPASHLHLFALPPIWPCSRPSSLCLCIGGPWLGAEHRLRRRVQSPRLLPGTPLAPRFRSHAPPAKKRAHSSTPCAPCPSVAVHHSRRTASVNTNSGWPTPRVRRRAGSYALRATRAAPRSSCASAPRQGGTWSCCSQALVVP